MIFNPSSASATPVQIAAHELVQCVESNSFSMYDVNFARLVQSLGGRPYMSHVDANAATFYLLLLTIRAGVIRC